VLYHGPACGPGVQGLSPYGAIFSNQVFVNRVPDRVLERGGRPGNMALESVVDHRGANGVSYSIHCPFYGGWKKFPVALGVLYSGTMVRGPY